MKKMLPRLSKYSSIAGRDAIAFAGGCIIAACLVLCAGCSRRENNQQKTVVVYTCLDQVYSEPILKAFEKQTGIRVLPVYDAESAKTTGLVNRLLARRGNPDCDVFWNNEVLQTERLAQKGMLASYVSPQAKRFPRRFRDEHGRWTGFAARMRVIIYNTNIVSPEDVPSRLEDFASAKWRGKAAIARPYFGTTLTHMIVLHQRRGQEWLLGYLNSLRGNDVALCSGNGPVRDMVAAGERAFGLTDTDDAHGAMLDGKPVGVVIPDAPQGAVLIPNTVAMIANCPHPEAARKLIDYLLSPDVERKLARGRGAQIPLATDLSDVKTPWDDLPGKEKAMEFDIPRAAASVNAVVELLNRAEMDK